MKDSLASATSTVSETASQAPQMLRQQTQGNPLAAGLIAFGVGWLVGSLLPASSRERQVAQRAQDSAGQLTEPVKQKAHEAAGNLQHPLQKSIEQLTATARHAAGQTTEQAKTLRRRHQANGAAIAVAASARTLR